MVGVCDGDGDGDGDAGDAGDAGSVGDVGDAGADPDDAFVQRSHSVFQSIRLPKKKLGEMKGALAMLLPCSRTYGLPVSGWIDGGTKQ